MGPGLCWFEWSAGLQGTMSANLEHPTNRIVEISERGHLFRDCLALVRATLRVLGKHSFGVLKEISGYRLGELISLVICYGWF